MEIAISFKFIDLFSGLGGFHIALKDKGLSCVFASEIDKDAIDVYYKNFNHIPANDITKVKNRDIPHHDILCAGFPCQAFSISGKQLGFNDTRGTLFFEIVRIARSKKPKVLFLENVKNLQTHQNGSTFEVIKKTLNKVGYNVYFKVLCSSAFGVPQHRERIYIVAFRKDIDSKKFRFPTGKKIKVVRDILIKLNASELKKLLIIRNDIKINKNRKVTNLTRPFKIGTINKGGQGERIYSIDAQGITLSANGGGAAAKTGAYLVNGKIRKLHPRECLNMQGFPKNYILDKSNNISWRLTGNSVSVPVIKEITKEILKILAV